MDIHEYYIRNTINGIPRSEFMSVLQNTNAHLSANAVNGRLLLVPHDNVGKQELENLFTSRMIKCVYDYYRKPGTPPIAKSSNRFLMCDKVRNCLGIDYVSRNDCKACHMRAIHLTDEGDLERKVCRIKKS